MTCTDPLDQLSAARPFDSELADVWQAGPSDRVRGALSTKIASSSGDIATGQVRPAGPEPRRHRRWLAAGLVATAATAALIIVPPLLSPDAAPSAAALVVLAETARAQQDWPIPEGKFVHRTISDDQTGQFAASSVRETWTEASGRTWGRDRADGGAWTYWRHDAEDPRFQPADLAALDADTDSVRAFLRSVATGSNSEDEALFVAAGDLLRTGYAPPAIAQATLRVLAEMPQIRTETSVFSGIAAVTVTFDDQQTRPGTTYLIFDKETADVVGEGTNAPDITFRSTITDHGLVDELPAEVATRAVGES